MKNSENLSMVRAAYHRAIARHKAKTGVSYPLIRESCVCEGRIYSTNAIEPELLAKYRRTKAGTVTITLV